MNDIKNIKVDHCPPGFSSNIGSGKEWSQSYRSWLSRRGFHEELRMLEIAFNRSPAARKKKKQKDKDGTK